jgi:hypothetical protein
LLLLPGSSQQKSHPIWIRIRGQDQFQLSLVFHGGIQVFLKSLWERVRPQRKPQTSVVLNPVEQVALRFLISFGPSTRESVYTEVNSTRPADASHVDEALGRLESLELVESRLRIDADQSETLSFLPTRQLDSKDTSP